MSNFIKSGCSIFITYMLLIFNSNEWYLFLMLIFFYRCYSFKFSFYRIWVNASCKHSKMLKYCSIILFKCFWIVVSLILFDSVFLSFSPDYPIYCLAVKAFYRIDCVLFHCSNILECCLCDPVSGLYPMLIFVYYLRIIAT